ncbi:MAG TPA: hypothetical protein VGU67_03765 [Edaphobacter sp.]|nr:hypothetical protein [Edaphobacter sp.]
MKLYTNGDFALAIGIATPKLSLSSPSFWFVLSHWKNRVRIEYA